MKRPASAVTGSSKKPAADPTVGKVAAIALAIKESESLPGSCKSMVVSMLPTSLSVYAEERHAFQVQAVKMAGEALSSVFAEKTAKVAAMQAKVDGSDAEKATRASAVDSAKAELEILEATESAAKATAAADKEAAATCVQSTKQAKHDLAMAQSDAKTVAEKLATLETTLKESFEPFKEAKAPAPAIKALAKVLLASGSEVGMTTSIEATLKKDAAERGTFDALVLGQVEEALKKYIAEATAAVASVEPNTASKTAAVEAAAAAETASAEKKEASAAALAAATDAKKAGEVTLKAAEKAVATFEPEMKQATSDLEYAKEDLTSFQEGALAYFTELKTYAPPPPTPEPEPVPMEEAPAAEPVTTA